MIYTSIILELLNEKKYQENIELLTLGLIDNATDVSDTESIRKLSYFLEGMKEALMITENTNKKKFLKKIIKVMNEKGDNYVRKN